MNKFRRWEVEAQWIRDLALVFWYVCCPLGIGVADPQLSCGRGSVYREPLDSWLVGGEEGPVIESPHAENNVNPDIPPNWELSGGK